MRKTRTHSIRVLFDGVCNCAQTNTLSSNDIRETLLHIACLNGRKQMVILLLDNGACPLKENNSGNTPYWYTGDQDVSFLLQKYRVYKIRKTKNTGNHYVMEPGYHPECLPTLPI